MSAGLGYLLKKFPRLSETFVLGEILAQEELGRGISVYSRREPDDEPRHPELARLRAEVHQLPSSSGIDPFTLLLEGAEQDPRILEKLAATLQDLRPLEVQRLPKLVAEALWIVADTRRRGIRHLHVHFATESAIVAHIAHRLGGPGYSITAHAKDLYRTTVDPHLLGRLVEGSAFTVTVCDANVEHLRERLEPAAMAKVRRHYNGIEQSLYVGLERRPVPGRILSIGRLVEKKGFDTLLDALDLLSERGVEFEAELIGEGEERQALERRAAEGPSSARVRFLGALPADSVRERLARAAVFGLPCRIGADGNRDALPTVLLEAQAAGVPLVSAPVGGVAEILDQGRAGHLVPSDDPHALADILAGVLSDPERERERVEHGRRLGARLFDRATQARTLHGWFDEALAAQEVPCASSA